uniref:Mal, T cell differentiation protein like n=1 Tax=Leptobrachium leishanense TaxID=445787 RepID=A0A8C5WK74_9ANUR
MASQGIQIPSSVDVPDIPYGLAVFKTFPYALILPELILGSWVWILVAATRVFYSLSQGWVMYVAISSFLLSMILLMVYVFGFHRNNTGTWRLVDVMYHGITAIFYLSASVLQANATITCNNEIISGGCTVLNYHLNAAATIFAFLTTLLYVLHSFRNIIQ